MTSLLGVDDSEQLAGYLSSNPVLARFEQLSGDTCSGHYNILGLEYNLAEKIDMPDISIGFHPDQLLNHHADYPSEIWYPPEADHAVQIAADWNRHVADDLSLYFEYDFDRYQMGVTDPGLYFSFSTGGPLHERIVLIKELLPSVSDHCSVDAVLSFLNEDRDHPIIPAMTGRMFSRNDPGFRFSFLAISSETVRSICEAFEYPGDTDALIEEFTQLAGHKFSQIIMMIQFDQGMHPVVGFECFYPKKEQHRYKNFCESLPEFGLPEMHDDYRSKFKPVGHRYGVPNTFWTQRAIRMISHVKMVFDGEKMAKSKIYYRIIFTT